ncbi:MAG: ketol-acid reductoisomerase [Vampirovibrionales bacterium]
MSQMVAPQTQEALKVYYDAEIDRSKLLGQKIAVIGFGSQGFGQSMNLKDSGANVRIALRSNSATRQKAEQAGFEVIDMENVAEWADFIMILAPDVFHKDIYEQYLQGKMRAGQSLVFSHGFSIHYGEITPPADINVFLIAPKGPGHLVRGEFQRGRGVPALVAIHQDASGEARDLAFGYAACVGGGRGGVIETTFKNETETDLFGEQAVLCGGASALVKAGFETLVEAGYPPELAYFECLHELKLIVDLMYEGGLEDMRYSISDTARYGDVTRGPRVITDATKQAMKAVLDDIQSGRFAREWITEYRAGMPNLKAKVEADRQHPLEVTGQKLRGMMSWLQESRFVDRTSN